MRLPAELEDWRRDLLTDPQTSGGLLIAVAEADSEEVLALVHRRGFSSAAVIGRLVAGPPQVRVPKLTLRAAINRQSRDAVT